MGWTARFWVKTPATTAKGSDAKVETVVSQRGPRGFGVPSAEGAPQGKLVSTDGEGSYQVATVRIPVVDADGNDASIEVSTEALEE